ncbi:MULTISPECIES: carbohydrate ABC transporter permease [Paenibacillus]|uniref:Carbohydrate ABC transporter permease n=1 Tax=Paenibacillus lautus TaxID=1401 RepID=A0A385TR05_PAELA|nr:MULTISPECIES: carbohydrate ABC transporter permease [Paenibacillus]MBY0163746.1 carbohydrate ABC transporter permease [Cytobacillus firmus]AYB46156.1 carbohydrate ABC transporter permease [Paenibacillus lautus]EGG36285.1 protein LplC [Paenibacillus sp. HGF5]MCI1773998.1 carbohydrate ABC transporter permease [Paenibacillus lautus]GIP06446.1 putative ABC transporter permease protein YtcP [Paenibacillus lautus]
MSGIKPTTSERIFDAANIVFLIFLSLMFVIPFLAVLSTSFISAEESMRRGAFVLIPERLDFAAYDVLLNRGKIILNAYQVTIFRVIVGTILNLLFTSMLAYGLARRSLPGRNALVLFIFLTMIFQGGLIPNYMLMDTLGLKDTLWVLILPSLISAWNLFILRNFFMGLPEELEESAVIDGATPLLILFKIVIPLSMPAMATIGLFYAVHHWNDWFGASIYMNDVNKMPVQVIMRNILLTGITQNEAQLEYVSNPPPAATLKSAVIIISTLPILFAYPFLQKYFVKGVMVGSIKG